MPQYDNPLKGISVVAFESRMADETANLLEKYGADVLSAPSMQEVPLEDHAEVFQFANHLFSPTGAGIDLLIFTTGIGTEMLVETLETRYDHGKIVRALSDLISVARGPKPTRVLKKLKIPIDVTVPEPNTWKEILEALDQNEMTQNLSGKQVAIQEYGEPNRELNRQLIERGASIIRVPIYRWALPEDMAPLKQAIRSIIGGDLHVAVFTSKTQIRHLMKAAALEENEEKVRAGLNNMFVAAIGPVCSNGLEEQEIEVDFIPSRPKLGVFIKELAERVPAVTL